MDIEKLIQEFGKAVENVFLIKKRKVVISLI